MRAGPRVFLHYYSCPWVRSGPNFILTRFMVHNSWRSTGRLGESPYDTLYSCKLLWRACSGLKSDARLQHSQTWNEREIIVPEKLDNTTWQRAS